MSSPGSPACAPRLPAAAVAAYLPGAADPARHPVGHGGTEASAARWVELSRSEPEQFGRIFEAYFAQVHSYVARRLGPDAADDIAAATFETAFAKRLGFDPAQGSVRAWLLGIATRHISRRRRDEARRYRALERLPVPVPAAGLEEQVASKVIAEAGLRQLAGVLAGMSQGDRDVLLLVALAELPLADVSYALGIPYGTVGSRLNRARRLIRQHAADIRGANNE